MANRWLEKFKGLRRSSQVLIIVVLLGIPTLLALVSQTRRPVRDLSDKFMQALAQQQPEAAYLLTSPGYRRDLSANAFQVLIQAHGLNGHQSHHWTNCLIKGSLGFCTGSYRDARGKDLPLTLHATGYPEGWQVDYIRFEKDPPSF